MEIPLPEKSAFDIGTAPRTSDEYIFNTFEISFFRTLWHIWKPSVLKTQCFKMCSKTVFRKCCSKDDEIGAFITLILRVYIIAETIPPLWWAFIPHLKILM